MQAGLFLTASAEMLGPFLMSLPASSSFDKPPIYHAHQLLRASATPSSQLPALILSAAILMHSPSAVPADRAALGLRPS